MFVLCLVFDALECLLPVIAFVRWFAFACKQKDDLRMKTLTECLLLERAFDVSGNMGWTRAPRKQPDAITDVQSILKMCSHRSDRQCGVLPNAVLPSRRSSVTATVLLVCGSQAFNIVSWGTMHQYG